MTTTRRRPRMARAAMAAVSAILMLTASIGSAVAADPLAPTETPVPPLLEPQALAAGQLTTKKVVSGFSSPLGVTNAGDGTGRLFVVERGGRVRIVQGTSIVSGSFLDASGRVSTSGSERGLLGLAFHPDFRTNRQVFIFYTRAGGDIVVSRLTANSARTFASFSTEEQLLVVEHSANTNHNGGGLAFGPDGYLYIATGDGGGGGDPAGNAQDTGSRLGKILRMDVDGAGTGDVSMWAYGLRNPWRISFDRGTGAMYIADVGQNAWEEIDRELPGHAGGSNYGWNVLEGRHCYPAGTRCSLVGDTLPVAEYSHTGGNCSITGGYVYRGESQRDLQGLYVFGDFCSGRIWTMPANGSSITQRRDTALNISSFGESESGELYMLDLGGTLYRVIAPEFSDIVSSTFINDIDWLAREGITGGCGGTRFCPKSPVSRVQMAQFLDRALDLPPTTTNYFRDDDGITGEASIDRLAAAGFTGGCAADRYCPSDPVTREQMAMFLDRAFELDDTSTDFFSDDSGRTGEVAINRLAAARLTGGCGVGRYCPTASVTREQMAAFLHRALTR